MASNMEHEQLVKFILAPMIAAIIAMIGWSMIQVIELKEEIATVKTDVKYISKQVDLMQEKLALKYEMEIYASK